MKAALSSSATSSSPQARDKHLPKVIELLAARCLRFLAGTSATTRGITAI